MLEIPENGITPGRPDSPKHSNNELHGERFVDLDFEKFIVSNISTWIKCANPSKFQQDMARGQSNFDPRI